MQKHEQIVQVGVNAGPVKKKRQNRIRTTKYRIWSFPFVFLYEQYQRPFNVFTLAIFIINNLPFAQIISPATLLLPILFVLVVAAVREIIEDVGRFQADKFANHKLYSVIRDKEYHKEILSQDIAPGDILILRDHQEVPADCVLFLSSNSPSNQAFINTANLDGENNLKSKNQTIKYEIPNKSDEEAMIETFLHAEGIVEVDPPKQDITNFNGLLKLSLGQEAAAVSVDTLPEPAVVPHEPVVEMTQSQSSSQTSLNQVHSPSYSMKRFEIDSVLLKGVVLNQTQFAVLGVIYTGMNTRVIRMQQKNQVRRSRIEQRLNRLQLILIALIVFLLIIHLILSSVILPYNYTDKIFNSLEPNHRKANFYIIKFLQIVVILSYLLPISLMVTLELTRFFQSLIIEADNHLKIEPLKDFIASNPKAKISESEFSELAPSQLSIQIKNFMSVENLAETDVIFSDKTGTLTKNEMDFHSYVDQTGHIKYAANEPLQNVELFCVGLCHTIEMILINGESQYQGTSPDEIAFVKQAAKNGLSLIKTGASTATYQYKNTQILYEILAVIPFTSSRKRMSVILKEISYDDNYNTPTEITIPGQPFCVTKGADNIMFELLTFKDQSVSYEQLVDGVNLLSDKGLRTLLYGYRTFDIMFIEQWLENWQEIKQLSENDEKYEAATQKIEINLNYGLISAVEDQLQDNLKQTLEILSQAGISIWMLTGDKTLTAKAIAKASGLSHPTNVWIELTQEEVKQLAKENNQATNEQIIEEILYRNIEIQKDMLEILQQNTYLADLDKAKKVTKSLSDKPPVGSLEQKRQQFLTVNTTIIMDAEFLRSCIKYNFHAELFHLCFHSKVVVACRLFPNEKSLVVKYCHLYHPKMLTVSIGDGANDIPMIKQSHVGIGIASKEGLYACNSADVSIPEFQFLKRLLLVHSRLNHYRNSELIDYSLYKNSIVVFANMIFQYYCNFSSTIAVESLLLMMFNTIITAISIFIFTISEKDVYEVDLLSDPNLFKKFYKRYYSNVRSVAKSLFFALYAAIITFFMCYYWIGDGVISPNGFQSDIYFFQAVIMYNIILISQVAVLLIVKQWSIATFIGLVLSVAITYGTLLVGSQTTFFGVGLIGFFQKYYSGIGPTVVTIYTVSVSLIPVVIEHFVMGYLSPYQEFKLMLGKSRLGCHREYT